MASPLTRFEGPVATTRSAAPPEGSVYCACHEICTPGSPSAAPATPFCFVFVSLLSPFVSLLFPFVSLLVALQSLTFVSQLWAFPFLSLLVAVLVGHCVRLLSLLSPPFVSGLVSLLVGHCVYLLVSLLVGRVGHCVRCLPSVSFCFLSCLRRTAVQSWETNVKDLQGWVGDKRKGLQRIARQRRTEQPSAGRHMERILVARCQPLPCNPFHVSPSSGLLCCSPLHVSLVWTAVSASRLQSLTFVSLFGLLYPPLTCNHVCLPAGCSVSGLLCPPLPCNPLHAPPNSLPPSRYCNALYMCLPAACFVSQLWTSVSASALQSFTFVSQPSAAVSASALQSLN